MEKAETTYSVFEMGKLAWGMGSTGDGKARKTKRK